jgi:hypothetical protein
MRLGAAPVGTAERGEKALKHGRMPMAERHLGMLPAHHGLSATSKTGGHLETNLKLSPSRKRSRRVSPPRAPGSAPTAARASVSGAIAPWTGCGVQDIATRAPPGLARQASARHRASPPHRLVQAAPPGPRRSGPRREGSSKPPPWPAHAPSNPAPPHLQARDQLQDRVGADLGRCFGHRALLRRNGPLDSRSSRICSVPPPQAFTEADPRAVCGLGTAPLGIWNPSFWTASPPAFAPRRPDVDCQSSICAWRSCACGRS